LATHGCHRVGIIRCSGTYNDKDGHFLTKQPEYETVWPTAGIAASMTSMPLPKWIFWMIIMEWTP